MRRRTGWCEARTERRREKECKNHVGDAKLFADLGTVIVVGTQARHKDNSQHQDQPRNVWWPTYTKEYKLTGSS